jgi:hypothetical protein
MKVRRIILLSVALGFLNQNLVWSQRATQEPKNIQEMMTPLKPADGRPYVFYSQADYEAAKISKAEAIKLEIRKHHDNPQRVKVLRENLWRIENAIVQSSPK